MKITLLKLIGGIVCIYFATCSCVCGQGILEQKISIHAKHEKLFHVLEKIENKGNIKFIYSHQVISANRFINFSAKQQQLSIILENLLPPLQIDYELVNNKILLKHYSSNESSQKERILKGRITDATTGEGIPQANIQLKNTLVGSNHIGTSTDVDGNFSIRISSINTVLSVTFIGYKQQEVTVGRRSFVAIGLKEDMRKLGEVIVVGYGTQNKIDVTGAVSTVTVNRATNIPTTNITEMLRGQAEGIQVMLDSARPGGSSNILIRGKRSISGGNDPLIILDDFPIDNINDINSEDIASIEVLKDAAAQAIYGARAANGVILITTKRGKLGNLSVNLHSYYTGQEITKNFELFSPMEFAQFRREAVRSTNPGGLRYSSDIINFGGTTQAAEYTNYTKRNFTDWENTVLKPATTTSTSLSISGGNENSKIYSSISHFKQTGLIPNAGYERTSFRLNLNQKINRKIDIETNVNLFSDFQQKESTSLNFITISPLLSPYDSNGNLAFKLTGAASYINPLWNLREATNDSKTNVYNLNFAGNYVLNSHFSYRLNTLYSRRFSDEGTYKSRLHSEGISANGIATITNSIGEEFLIENILNYTGQISSHHTIDATLVQSVSQKDFSTTFISGTNFNNDILGYDGISNALNFKSTRSEYRKRLVGFLGRIRYTLFDKYLLNFTMRRDASSVFAESKKWGFFPAVALAWKIHQELFFKEINAINELKLRVSYGSVGNQAIAPYQTLGLVTSNPYILGGIIQGGYLPGSFLPNPDLTWETSATFNAGLDFSLLKNRISGSIEYYNTLTTNLLTTIPLGGISGFSTTITNGGEIQNKGIELHLVGSIIRNKKIRWTIESTFAKNTNVLLKTGIIDENGNQKNDLTKPQIIGKPLGLIYSVLFDGIFQTDAEALSSAQAKKDATGKTYQPLNSLFAGSIKLKDLNNDGIIDTKDIATIPIDPNWYGSFSTSIYYKNFELLADIYTVQGATKYNPYLAQFNEGGYNTSILNGMKRDYWTPENHSNSYPRPNLNTKAENIEVLGIADASYIRLRTLSLAYNIPPDLLGKLKIDSFKIYITANNSITITKYKSYNPENNPSDFPDAKGLTIGLRIGF